MSYIVVLVSDEMGHTSGDSEIGRTLMKAFLHTLTSQEELPTHVLLYNSAVRLNQEGEDTLEDLKVLDEKGVKLITCGLCLDYFEQGKDNLPYGEVGTMGQFVQIMREAEHIVEP